MVPATAEKLLITVHGIMSDNDGLARLGVYCNNHVNNFFHWPIYYKFTSPFEILSNEQLEFIFEFVRSQLLVITLGIKVQLALKQRNRYPEITLVAHSLGTMATLTAIQKGLPDLKIQNLVLLGSILKRNEVWTGYGAMGILGNDPFNVARPFDRVVQFGKAIGGGLSGTRGFIQTGPFSPKSTFKDGGHTAYDPNDFADIANVMNGQSCPLVPYDCFHKTLGVWSRSRLWFRRLARRS